MFINKQAIREESRLLCIACRHKRASVGALTFTYSSYMVKGKPPTKSPADLKRIYRAFFIIKDTEEKTRGKNNREKTRAIIPYNLKLLFAYPYYANQRF